jgi:hypothetical protein
MKNYVREVSDLTNEILEAQWALTPFEAMQIAVKIQQNQILADAFTEDHPFCEGGVSVFHKIAAMLSER